MVHSSIDIGTNTIRLLIVDEKERCNFVFLHQQSRIARLGESFLPQKMLQRAAIGRAIKILREYKEVIDAYRCRSVFAVATSAVREAKNRSEFLSAAKEETGIDIEVIDEKQEAELTHEGILFFLKDTVKDKKWVAFDIGGGSTEFMFSSGKHLENPFSVPLGVVKLLERFVKHEPPHLKEIESAVNYFIDKLFEFDFEKNVDAVVANAGTVTTLAAIDMKLKKYDYKKTEGYLLKKESVFKLFKEMLGMSSKDRLKAYPILEKGREDVIVVGTYLVYRLLETFKKEYLITTNGSLREGVILKELCNG